MNTVVCANVSVAMNASLRSPLALVIGLLVTTTTLSAQRPTVTLFSGTHFTGEQVVIVADGKIDDFNFTRFPSGRSANNRVSSIRIDGEAEVTLFLYREFSGEQITLHHSIARLADIGLRDEPETWDNNLSSLTVRAIPLPSPQPVRRTPDFVGPVLPSPRGHDHPGNRSRESRHPDSRNQTAQIVRNAYRDILDREPDARGLSQYVGIVEDRGWTEDRLRNELRRSAEYRDVTIPRQITAAYREVLNREADSAGKSFYTNQMINRGWTVARVRDALRRSPEYAQQKSSSSFIRPAEGPRSMLAWGPR